MSMASIRDYYKVPAIRGGLISVGGRLATILSGTHQLRVKFDDGTVAWAHPTWSVEYLLCDEAVEVDGREEPCERPAVGHRVDAEFFDEGPYPVCRRHFLPPFTVAEARAMAEVTP